MIGDNTCPAGIGEVVAEDCRYLNEFAEAASAMSVLNEASRELVCTGCGTTDGGDCVGEIKIFNGQGKECLQNGWDTTFSNCYNNSEGSFLAPPHSNKWAGLNDVKMYGSELGFRYLWIFQTGFLAMPVMIHAIDR